MNSPQTLRTIQIQYTCHRCRTTNRSVTVRAREPGEDVVTWVREVVGVGASNDHARWAPFCSSQKVDLKIPMPSSENGYLGQPEMKAFGVEKGRKGGECYRTACTSTPAEWFNISTHAYYCESCAAKINSLGSEPICKRANENG